MRLAANFPKWLVFVVLIIIAHFCEPFPCWAQAKEPVLPEVSLTIFLVPEKEACKPFGYQAYDADKSINCPPLTMEDINRWREAGFLSQTITIPPTGIALSNRIIEFLDIYRKIPKDKPERRRAAVFFFEWPKSQQSAVSLERQVDPSSAHIPAMKWSGSLNNETFWIHQERADTLSPAYNIKWILQAGNNIWKFNFLKK
jgi:hypothetical protein